MAALVFRFVMLVAMVTQTPSQEQQNSQVQSKCEDRSLVIQVESMEVPQFEAIDENGSQILKEPLAARCGYTIISNKMATSTTLRASFFSCYTHNQNDVKFTFRFNVRLRTSKGIWETQSISTLCFGPKWAHREVICEEDYMEVNVNQDSCEATQEVGDQFWGVANSQVQSSTKATWQLMFLQGDGHKTFMSIQEAESLGYIVTSSAHRVVLRTDQRSPHAKVMMVHGVPVEVIQVSVVFRRLQMVVLLDLTMACTLNSGEFNGAWLLWDVPWVMLPLVDESAVFESQYVGIRVDGEFLDQNNATSKGLRLVHSGDLVLIAVPFRAEGGYRKSWVVNNTYKEEFGISLLYEHDFSLTYDGSRRINIKHRLLRVLATPPLCHPPFSLDQTLDNDVAFHILLGNIPSDVVLEEVWINKKQVMSGASNPAIFITPMLYANGSRAFDLRLPFQDASIRTTYLGGGVVQYSAHLKFTLTIIPQRESYYHHTFVSSRVTNTFPPQIMAQCLHQGICFTIVQASPSLSLWEVGVDHEPLTFELVAQRGYKLHNDSHRMTLEVPIYSIGYRYDDINLFNFYGTFELLLRDSRTLQVQASTSKRCLFKTEDMTVCSSDGTITVITGTKSTRPTVQLKKLHLLDPDCRPKQLDESRALFEFRVNTCGTRPMVGESYVVYENEVIHDRQLITDGPNLISRDSQFKLSIRCFYPLNTINRLSMDRIFTTDHANKTVEQNCLPSTFGSLTRAKIRQMPDTEEKVSETSYFSTVPGETQLDPFKNLQMFLTRNTGPVFEKASSFSDQIPSPTETQNIVDQFSKVLGIVEQHNIEQPQPGHAKQTGEHLGPSVFTWDPPNGFEPSQDLRGLWENHSLSPHQDVSPDINNQPASTAAQWLDPNTAQTRSMDKRNAKVAGFRVQDITVKSIPKSKQDRPVPDQENIQASHTPGSGKVLTEIQRNWNRKPHQDPQNVNTQPKVPKLAVVQQELQQDQEKLPTVSENKDKKMAFPAGVSHSTARSGPAIAARMQIWTRPHHYGNPYFGRNLDLDLSPHKRFTSALFIRGRGPNRRYSPSVESAGPVPDKETHSKSDGLSSYGFSDHQGIDRGE